MKPIVAVCPWCGERIILSPAPPAEPSPELHPEVSSEEEARWFGREFNVSGGRE